SSAALRVAIPSGRSACGCRRDGTPGPAPSPRETHSACTPGSRARIFLRGRTVRAEEPRPRRCAHSGEAAGGGGGGVYVVPGAGGAGADRAAAGGRGEVVGGACARGERQCVHGTGRAADGERGDRPRSWPGRRAGDGGRPVCDGTDRRPGPA